MNRTILHIDINNFYASVEVRDNPALKDLPVAVAGSVENRHGIILAKNQLAKSFGVKTAETIWEAKRKCPGLVIVPPRGRVYMDISRRSVELLSTYSDRVEPFGLDEAWLDISAYAPRAEDGIEIANELRTKYKESFGITASVGVSFNKVFAKLGSDLKKPDATTLIWHDNFKQMVWNLPVEELIFVGGRTKEKLNKRGIRTIGQLANADKCLLHSWLGVAGDKLCDYANGLDCSPVKPVGAQQLIKSVGNSSTPPSDIHTILEAHSLLQTLSEMVAERLRKERLLGTTVVIYVRDNVLASFDRQIRLKNPTCLSTEICAAGVCLLKENYDWRRPIRSLGIRVTGLTTADSPVQLSFFNNEEQRSKYETVERAIDKIRASHGRDVIKLGVAAYHNKLSHIPSKDERLKIFSNFYH